MCRLIYSSLLCVVEKLVFYVEQKISSLTGETKRIASTQVTDYLNRQEPAQAAAAPQPSTTTSFLFSGVQSKPAAPAAPSVRQQLEQQLAVVSIYPLVGLTDEQIKSYLENVPVELNPLLWEQAKKANPNPKKLMPVAIVGFQGWLAVFPHSFCSSDHHYS